KTKTTSVSGKRPKIEACSLIANDEVQAIQGSPIKDVKPSEQSDGTFRVAQCFYTAETFNKSVSLAAERSRIDQASQSERILEGNIRPLRRRRERGRGRREKEREFARARGRKRKTAKKTRWHRRFRVLDCESDGRSALCFKKRCLHSHQRGRT